MLYYIHKEENMKIENCIVNPGVIPSLMNPDYGNTSVPVKNHSIPGLIKAVDYDIGGVGVAYNDADYMIAVMAESQLDYLQHPKPQN